MPDTSYMKEDQNGAKSRETIPGLGYSKNTVRMYKTSDCIVFQLPDINDNPNFMIGIHGGVNIRFSGKL